MIITAILVGILANFAAVFGTNATTDIAGIRNLMGEPDYRQVRLHWEAEPGSIPENGYQVRYCELQTWGTQRCRTLAVAAAAPPEEEDNHVDGEGARAYDANIRGLRMATTYSFEVKEQGRTDRADGDDINHNVIVIPTKGFSAKATQCLPEASEIEVATGPFFGGRIAVEAADGERCALDGEPASPRDTYTLRINHTECGSRVNETTVATFVIVQENLPILTHSTRRFLVLCSYQPETLTVRAGINLPTGAGRGHAHTSDGGGSAAAKRGRTGRLLQRPQALVKEELAVPEPPQPSKLHRTNIVPIVVITMLSLAGIIGLAAIALKITSKKLLGDFDNVSIASEVSTSSSCSTVDLEIATEHHPPTKGTPSG